MADAVAFSGSLSVAEFSPLCMFEVREHTNISDTKTIVGAAFNHIPLSHAAFLLETFEKITVSSTKAQDLTLNQVFPLEFFRILFRSRCSPNLKKAHLVLCTMKLFP